jgi:DNA-binding transcriptional LysR family regulator
MELDQIRAFVATIDQGSLSGAARLLGRTQPAVTRLIQALEAEVGTSLLDRSTRPAQPTPRGLAIVESARKVLDAVGELECAARPRKQSLSLPLRLGISHAMVRLLGGAPLSRWKKAHPRIALKVESNWSLALLGLLMERRLDAALGPFSVSWAPPVGLRGVRLGEDELVVVAPPGMTVPAEPTLSRLMDHPWILNPDGCGVRAHLERTFAESGRVVPPAVEVTGDFGVLLELVAAGLGVTLAPRWMATVHPMADRLQVHPLSEGGPRTAFWLCSRPLPASLDPAVRALEGAFRETLAEVLGR